jgi:GxxExxY protein
MCPLVQDVTGNDLTRRIIGAAMAVHNRIGPGYKEEIYEKALYNELQRRAIPAEMEYPLSVTDEGQVVGIFYLDLWVEQQVVVEIKAFAHQLTDDERAQVINYLKAAQAPVGLLFNFGRRSLEFRRIFPGKNLGSIQRVGRDDIRKTGRSNE